MDESRREAVGRFTEVADEDMRVARMCLEAAPPALRMAVVHSQQAAEKYLKALLVALGEDDPPFTHNLVELGDMLTARDGPALDIAALRFLTRFAVKPRYGLAHVGVEEAERAVAGAETVVDALAGQIAEVLEPPASAGSEQSASSGGGDDGDA